MVIGRKALWVAALVSMVGHAAAISALLALVPGHGPPTRPPLVLSTTIERPPMPATRPMPPPPPVPPRLEPPTPSPTVEAPAPEAVPLSPGAANDPAEATDPGVPNPSTLAPPATLGKVPPVTVPPVVPSDLLLSRIHYPTLARTQGVEATVVLELSIDEAGRIGEVTVVQDPGWGFAAEARRALVGLLCEPALVDGVPVAVRYRYPIRFSLH